MRTEVSLSGSPRGSLYRLHHLSDGCPSQFDLDRIISDRPLLGLVPSCRAVRRSASVPLAPGQRDRTLRVRGGGVIFGPTSWFRPPFAIRLSLFRAQTLHFYIRWISPFTHFPPHYVAGPSVHVEVSEYN